MRKVIAIAGSDSSGGAGIQADIKTITLLGAYATSAITALTAQNTCGVEAIQPVPPEFVAKQIELILTDIGADAGKTGMLHTSSVIDAVASALQRFPVPNLVVDPVMLSKSGHTLLEDDAIEALVAGIFPLATLITPNAPEAGRILGREVKTLDDAEAAAREIVDRGLAPAVVVKGGHLKGEATDIFFDGSEMLHVRGERIQTTSTHGTGCTYASAIATFLAFECSLKEAVLKAKDFIGRALRFAEPIGTGHGPVNHYAAALEKAERAQLLASLHEALRKLQAAEIGPLIPEVQSNLAAALPWSASLDDIAAFPGRIIRFGNRIRTLACADFGASSHMGRALLAAKQRDPSIRAVMNIRFSEPAIRAAQALGFKLVSFDRLDQPDAGEHKEDSTLDWAVDWVFRNKGFIPDVIFDRGAVGKEAMVRVFGRSPIDVASKIIRLKNKLQEGSR